MRYGGEPSGLYVHNSIRILHVVLARELVCFMIDTTDHHIQYFSCPESPAVTCCLLCHSVSLMHRCSQRLLTRSSRRTVDFSPQPLPSTFSLNLFPQPLPNLFHQPLHQPLPSTQTPTQRNKNPNRQDGSCCCFRFLQSVAVCEQQPFHRWQRFSLSKRGEENLCWLPTCFGEFS